MARKKRRRKKERLMLLTGALAMTAAILLLALAAALLFGREEPGKAVSEEAVREEAGTEEPGAKGDSREQDPQAVFEQEQEGAEVPVSTVKEAAGETDELTAGVDVSEFQGTIDWEQAAAEGIDFAMVRVGYRTLESGEIQEDRTARYNLQEASRNGIRLGAYFFSTAVTQEEAREEARWTKELLAGYPITYPVAYNCEGFQEPSSRQYGLSVEARSDLAESFLEEIEAGGYTGMFYAARNELQDNLLWDADRLELQYRIWVAQYPETADPETSRPDYDGKYAMWQYTDRGSVSGIDGPVDLDAAYFGYSEEAEALEEGAAEHVEADPEVGVLFEEVEEAVTSKDETNLRSSMDQGGDENIEATLQNGEQALRTGVGNNGWSRLEYAGKTLYAVSSYLTTDLSYKPPAEEPDDGFKTHFTAVTENVTAKEVTNLRDRPSMEEPTRVIAQLHNGEVIARTGVSELGWSRVEYNGQTLYCISSYLLKVE